MHRIYGETPGGLGTRLVPTGRQFDAIRVPRFLGLVALSGLRRTGAVIVDPRERALYFLVPAGAADTWAVPETRALGTAEYLIVPPPARTAPPGPYWLGSHSAATWSLASAAEIHSALMNLLTHGAREGAA
ncbi:hypothetical protein [Streptomyces sp. ODS28]|uniref:hypothetical protein n=1 Tax=Streptomyces sp. ODS28 TaxID=3136688 RepID=UPI0031EB80BE